MTQVSFVNGRSPVPQTPALGLHVVSQLRHAIVAGEIPPNTHLVESQLSIRFDVSRGPIRDALRQLEAEGLVESHRRGVFAVGLRSADVDELYMLRELLEVKALELAHTKSTDVEWKRVELSLDAMKDRVEAQDSLGFARADLSFHSAFYSVAGGKRLESMWKQYEPTFAVMLELTNAEDRDLGPTYQDHLSLYTTLRSGDLSTAVAMLRTHLQGSRDRLTQSFNRLHGES
jgi:GntR family transcriptional regulator of gluconate operon